MQIALATISHHPQYHWLSAYQWASSGRSDVFAISIAGASRPCASVNRSSLGLYLRRSLHMLNSFTHLDEDLLVRTKIL